MPSRVFVAVVGVALMGLGLNGIRTGTVFGRIGRVGRVANPAWFWVRVVLYLALGVLAVSYAWTAA